MNIGKLSKLAKVCLAGVSVIGLAGCGGGGSSSSTPATVTTPTTTTPTTTTPTTTTPTTTTPDDSSTTIPTTLGEANVFADGAALSFAGGQTIPLQISPDGNVTMVELTQTSEPAIEFGTVTVTNPTGGVLSAGGSISSTGSGENFTFVFPDDDDTPRMATFSNDGSTVSLAVVLPAVTADTVVDWNFALTSGAETVDVPVSFTVTPSAASSSKTTVSSSAVKSLNVDNDVSIVEATSDVLPQSLIISGAVSEASAGNLVSVFDGSVPAQAEALSTTHISFDGTYTLEVNRDAITGDDVFVFVESESGESKVSSFGITDKGDSVLVPITDFTREIEINFSE